MVCNKSLQLIQARERLLILGELRLHYNAEIQIQ